MYLNTLKQYDSLSNRFERLMHPFDTEKNILLWHISVNRTHSYGRYIMVVDLLIDRAIISLKMATTDSQIYDDFRCEDKRNKTEALILSAILTDYGIIDKLTATFADT